MDTIKQIKSRIEGMTARRERLKGELEGINQSIESETARMGEAVLNDTDTRDIEKSLMLARVRKDGTESAIKQAGALLEELAVSLTEAERRDSLKEFEKEFPLRYAETMRAYDGIRAYIDYVKEKINPLFDLQQRLSRSGDKKEARILEILLMISSKVADELDESKNGLNKNFVILSKEYREYKESNNG